MLICGFAEVSNEYFRVVLEDIDINKTKYYQCMGVGIVIRAIFVPKINGFSIVCKSEK